MSFSERCLFAGFGGQGIMLMGQLVAQAGLLEGREVSWLPSYGPEMRGGTANCSVYLADSPIASPVIARNATALIVMNAPSLEKFQEDLEPGGTLLLNSSLAEAAGVREDVDVLSVPCTEIAVDLGLAKVANLVMLGAFVRATGCVTEASLLEAIELRIGAGKADLLEINKRAFAEGLAIAK